MSGSAGGKTIHVVPHAHVDLAWYWTRQETKALLRDIFDGALLPLMEADPDFRFTQDQALLFEELRTLLPPDRWKCLRVLVDEGRFELAGGFYVQPEFAEPCGESLVRQLLFGRRTFEAMFGRVPDCLWNIDSFGQSAQLPQLAVQSGFRRMVFMRGMPSEEAEGAPTEFLLRGPDGSTVLCHWMAGTYFIGRHGPIAEKLALLHAKCATGAILLPFGGDLYRHRQTAREVAALIADAAGSAGVPVGAVRVSTVSAFFDDVEEAVESGDASLKEWSPDLAVPRHLQDLRGTFVNRIGLKLANRRAERALLAVEVLLALEGADLAAADPLWKELLSCQFHDILGGSCIDAVADDAMARLEAVEAAATALLGRRLGASGGGIRLAVLNPAAAGPVLVRADVAFQEGAIPGCCTAVGEDGPARCSCEPVERHADGSLSRARLVLAASLPPWSVTSFRLVPVDAPASPARSERRARVLDNGILRVAVDPSTGDLRSIVYLPSGKELLEGQGNVLRSETEADPDLEGRLGRIERAADDRSLTPDSIRSDETPVGASISVRKRIDGCLVEKEIALVDGEDLVRFTTTVEVLDRRNRLIWAEFDVRDARGAVHAVPFAILERPDGFFPSEHAAGCTVEGGIVALLNQGPCGHRTEKGRIGLALLRTFEDFRDYRAMREANGFDAGMGGDCGKAAEVGRHVFRYALAFRVDKAGMAAAGHAFNHEPFAFQSAESRTADLLSRISDGFLVTAVKPAGTGSIILRGYETAGTGSTVTIAFTRKLASFAVSPLLEDASGFSKQAEAATMVPVPDGTGRRYEIPVSPFGIRTFRVVAAERREDVQPHGGREIE